MTARFKTGLVLGTIMALGTTVSAIADQPITNTGGPVGITLFTGPSQTGRSLHLNREVSDLASQGFGDQAQSILVTGGRWEICDGSRFRDDCEVFGAGLHNLQGTGWIGKVSSVRPINANTPTMTLFWGSNYSGESHTYASQSRGMKYFGTNEKAMSVRVNGGTWMLCGDSYLMGRCERVDQNIPDLGSWNFARDIASVGPAKEKYGSGFGNGQITFYDGPNQQGTRVTISGEVSDLNSAGFSNRASSIRLQGGVWEVCDHSGFTGHCEIVRRNVGDLGRWGMDNRISSVRPAQQSADGSGWNNGGGNGWNNGGGNGWNNGGGNGWNNGGGSGWHGGGGGQYGRSFGGQRTIFFPAPQMNGQPVASCLTPGFQCGKWAADKFCQSAGLNRSVYSDAAPVNGDVYYLNQNGPNTGHTSNMNNNSWNSKRKLVDVLCKR